MIKYIVWVNLVDYRIFIRKVILEPGESGVWVTDEGCDRYFAADKLWDNKRDGIWYNLGEIDRLISHYEDKIIRLERLEKSLKETLHND